MTARLRSLLALALLLCLGTSSAAQGIPRGKVRHVTEPLHAVRLDLETGTVTRGAAVQQRSAGAFTTSSTFSNLDHSGFVGVDSGAGTPHGPCEWIDSGVKGGGASGFVTGFSFAYCSAALDPLSGGTGGSARIGFRTGYVRGSANNMPAVSGNQVAAFNLTGLPANTACSAFFGGFNCFLMEVSIGSVPVVLPPGNLGWSWRFTDLGTDGMLAKTFPFLSCVQSCSGSGPDALGVVDSIDPYCPAGTAVSTFVFGTCATTGRCYYNSISIDLREAESIAPAVTTFNGNGTNPVLLSGSAPSLGSAWQVTTDCSGADPTKLAIFRFSFAPNPPPTSSTWGEVLVSLQAGAGINLFQPHLGASASFFNTVPLDLTFFGICWSVQSFCGDTPRGFLTNGITQTLGN